MSALAPISLHLTPHRKDELGTTLLFVSMQLEQFLLALPEREFTISKEGKWSPQQQLQHLVSSSSPVALSMQLPKQVLQVFGKNPTDASRSYGAIVEQYKEALLKGAKAPLPFRPVTIGNPSRDKLLAKWKKLEHSFKSTLYLQWNEEDLDTYRMPHPILGLLTIREMLFFTCYHILHHLNSMRQVYGN